MLETEPIELVGTLNVGQVGTRDYEKLINKPVINDIQLDGNLSSADLGLQPAGQYVVNETDPVFSASASAGITSQDITNWNNKSDFSGNYNDLSNKPDLSGFVTKDVNDLTNYYDKTTVDSKISSVYKYKGTVATYNDLPETGLTVGDVYNVASDGSNYAWTGTVWDKLGGDIDLSGYQTKIDSSHKLSADLVDDTSTTNKLTNATEKTTWNGKQDAIQFATMPTASADNLGKIYQYTGATNSTYTQGHFYIAIVDNNTYSWQEISFGGGSSYEPIVINTFDVANLTTAFTTWFSDYTTKGLIRPIIFASKGYSDNPDLSYMYTWNGAFSVSSASLGSATYHCDFICNDWSLNTSSTWVRVLTCNVPYNWSTNTLGTITIRVNTNKDNYYLPIPYNKKSTSVYRTQGLVLTTDNTTSYTPTGDYNPATKKYVDDLVGDISTILESLVTVQGGE